MVVVVGGGMLVIGSSISKDLQIILLLAAALQLHLPPKTTPCFDSETDLVT